MKKLNLEDVNKASYVWFMQKRSQAQPISGSQLCDELPKKQCHSRFLKLYNYPDISLTDWPWS